MYVWNFLRDVKYATRLLRRTPVFTVTASLVLALGIGSTTTIFSFANALLLRGPAGVAQPERLVEMTRIEPQNTFADPSVMYSSYLEVRQRMSTLEGVYAAQADLAPMSLRTPSGSERIFCGMVSNNYFSVLGVTASLGRVFDSRDSEQDGASPVVILSHSFWMRRFNGDPSIVGQTLQLNGYMFAVIGVAPDGFQGTGVLAADVWAPVAMANIIRPGIYPSNTLVTMGGRLGPGKTIKQAGAEASVVGRLLERETFRTTNQGVTLRLAAASPIPGNLRLAIAGFLALLVGMVIILLVISCANLMGVLLERAVERRREIAVRLAMGAARSRVIGQLVTETMVLFTLGGLAGLLLARVATTWLVQMLSALPLPVTLSVPLDARVVAFAMTLSLIAALLSGLSPGLYASKVDVSSSLKDSSMGALRDLPVRQAFIVVQVAFSLMLVVMAVLMVRALDHVVAPKVGFDPKGVEITSIDLQLGGLNDKMGAVFINGLTQRLRDMPGITAGAIADHVPRSDVVMGMAGEGATVPGVTPPPGESYFSATRTFVSPGFFGMLRVPLVRGRDFTDGDHDGTQPVVIVSESTAKRLWPGQDPIGREIVWLNGGGNKTNPTTRLTVVGVISEGRSENRGPMSAHRLSLYVPLEQNYTPHLTIFVRSVSTKSTGADIRNLVTSMNPSLPILSTQTLDSYLSGPVEVQLRVAASVSGSVGVIGLILASIGLYGLIAYGVTRRTREIGVRMAVGAESRDVLRLILMQGARLVAIGTITGLVAAALAARIFRSLLFGISTLDPLTFGGCALIFVAIGLIATYIPARRATRINPTDALRYE